MKVVDYINDMKNVDDPLYKAELIIRGFTKFFPFERASFFTYSPLTYMGEGLVQIDRDQLYPIQSIKEDVRKILPIYQAVTQNIPSYIHIKPTKENFPQKYVEQFQLTSLLIIPISFLKAVIGCVLIDKYTGQGPLNKKMIQTITRYFQLSVEGHILIPNHQHSLSKREIEVLQNLSNGHSIKEMAGTMEISEFTARDYISAAVRKLGARTRTEAVAIAIRIGIII